ncbi:UDP-glucoronosyl/UDP-glucosyl transferase family protein [Dorcoceras hygrometricum]|uniref:UDP-glucoronosyl/UDP-glucosyl transferase family protein n=1 Tax=Dorcoceras hygrometricum TaxID=472368 RepID=A0A2Z7C8R0_9LAMI|nr:UDP-glucoronosyl/UDP-glucosyl transferase family protein [Dorcoceras hygrometricum]
MFTTASDTDKEFIADQVFGTGVREMETEDVEQSADEAMSLEDILMTIPLDCPLPSTDIDLLVQLRERIIDEVDRFFNSFSLKRLATLKIDESYFDKEALILSRAETDSTRVALNRRTYILTNYRLLLIRKFLEARRINFTPGEGSSTTDLKVMEMISDLHMFVAEELKEQTIAHGLRREKPCCSKIFEGRPHDPGAIIARTNINTRSTCWIRTMICVDGVWVIEPCGDHWVKIPRKIVNNEILRQRSYDDTLPPISEFFKLMKKRWGDVCLEVAKFSISGFVCIFGSEITFRAIMEILEFSSLKFEFLVRSVEREYYISSNADVAGISSNADVAGSTVALAWMSDLLSVLGYDPMSLWGLVVLLPVLFSGNLGFAAGRGFNPVGGVPGGG